VRTFMACFRTVLYGDVGVMRVCVGANGCTCTLWCNVHYASMRPWHRCPVLSCFSSDVFIRSVADPLVMLLFVVLHWCVSEFCLRCCTYCAYCQNVHHLTLSSHCSCDFYIFILDLGNFLVNSYMNTVLIMCAPSLMFHYSVLDTESLGL
jgi:hypothetical protein